MATAAPRRQLQPRPPPRPRNPTLLSLSFDDLVFWLFVAAWVVVGAIFLFGIAPRIVRELLGIVRRLNTLLGESVITRAVAIAEQDAERLERAAARVPDLIERAQAALLVIRTTSLVPPAFIACIVRIGAEINAFRRASDV